MSAWSAINTGAKVVKKKSKHAWLSTVDRVHVAHSAPMSTEVLSTVFIKGSSSVLVVLEGGHMRCCSKHYRQAHSSILRELARVGHSGVTCQHRPDGVWNSCISRKSTISSNALSKRPLARLQSTADLLRELLRLAG